ncbi:MAG: SpoIIE family protein phosphatase [Candidatus Nanopelagicales bacterium]|jgi:serine phosphatase RsbU (regulator of sigma subunit)/anti-sigma regulatory factor (Ser/Thr protein kinase)|nr:SpoIIE family protein phosphatase [Candidatus Nanopelagicales bacterium]
MTRSAEESAAATTTGAGMSATRTSSPSAPADASGAGRADPLGPAAGAPQRRGGWRPRDRPRRTSPTPAPTSSSFEVAIDPADPLLDELPRHRGPVRLDALPAFSPAVRQMRADGVHLVVPLVASGELVGILALGERRSERGYSRDDLALLESLARSAAPALRVGQLVRQQEQEARNLQRIESELQVAQLIQQHYLPAELPSMHGWQVDAFYRPARTVGGDFYDVLTLPDGRLMVVTGDVTDKGVPAALVMASTYSLLRAAAETELSPGAVLRRVNDLLHQQIPTHMFVTCLVLFIDPVTGATDYANAGHNLPYRLRDGMVSQLDARGMPLGLMSGSDYDEATTVVQPGDVLVLYSDGITEQHDAAGDMFGFERTAAVIAAASNGAGIVDRCIDELGRFSAGLEQEDDITLVAVSRPATPGRTELRVSVPSRTGNEREVMDRVRAFVADALPPTRVDALGTAVAEATMNAIEHGNALRDELPVEVVATIDADVVRVAVTDLGGGRSRAAELPDLGLKLAGLQAPRGWGVFLIGELVDDVAEDVTRERHTVTLTMQRDGGPA